MDQRAFEGEAEIRNQSRHPNTKDVKKLHEYIEQIHVQIEHLAQETKKRLMNDREDLRIKLAQNLNEYRKELEEENDKRKKNEKNKDENEENLVKRLRLMTEVAE